MYFNTKYTLLILIIFLFIYNCNIKENLEVDNYNKMKQQNESERITATLVEEKDEDYKCPNGINKMFCKHTDDKYYEHNTEVDGIKVNCNANYKEDNTAIYCGVRGPQNGNVDPNDLSTCTITPHLGIEETTIFDGNPTKVCSSVKCPSGYVFYNEKNGGLCRNETTNKICALDPERAGDFEVCNIKADYIKNQNIDIIEPIGNSLTIKDKDNPEISGSKKTLVECMNLCNKYKPLLLNDYSKDKKKKKYECDFFTYEKSGPSKGRCSLKKIINTDNSTKSTIYKSKYVDTYMKLPVNYNMHLNKEFNGEIINNGNYTNKTVMKCAELCDKNPECETFVSGINNESSIGTCELKGRLSKKSELKFNSNKITGTIVNKYTPKIKNRNDKKFYNDLYPYTTDNIVENGNLCRFKTYYKNLHDKIESEIQEQDNLYENNKKIIDKENAKYIKNLKEITENVTKKKTLKFMINPKSIITWTRINTGCAKIEIELLRESYLQVSLIQIFGRKSKDSNKVENLQNFAEPVASSKLDDAKFRKILESTDYYTKEPISNNIHNCWGKYDLENFFSTDYEKNPKITINFDKKLLGTDNIEVIIDKIFIYNRIDSNQDNLVPLKIKLINSNDYVVREAIKNSFKEPLQLNKPLPKIPENSGIQSYTEISGNGDLGDSNMIREWVTINNTPTYCSINNLKMNDKNTIQTKQINKNENENEIQNLYKIEEDLENDSDKKHYHLKCTNTSNETFESKPIDPGYPETQFFKDMNNTGNVDFCRCIGTPPNTYVSCIPFESGNKFSVKEFRPRLLPGGCQQMTGEYLKNLNLDGTKKKCSEIIIDKPVISSSDEVNRVSLLDEYKTVQNNIIHAGFFNPINSEYTFFKNTKFNNNPVVLYSKIRYGRSNNSQVKLIDTGIINNISFPNLPKEFYTNIDAACFFNKNTIYLFNGDEFVKYNTKTKKIENDNRYIRDEWPKIPYFFTYDLTAVVFRNSGTNSNTNIVWFFKGVQYIELSLSNKTELYGSPKNINKELDINMSNIDTAMCSQYKKNGKKYDILYLFNKHRHIQYNFNSSNVSKYDDSYLYKTNNIINKSGELIKNGVRNNVFFNGKNIWNITNIFNK